MGTRPVVVVADPTLVDAILTADRHTFTIDQQVLLTLEGGCTYTLLSSGSKLNEHVYKLMPNSIYNWKPSQNKSGLSYNTVCIITYISMIALHRSSLRSG